MLEEGGETGDEARTEHGARDLSTPGQAMDSYAWEGWKDDRRGRGRGDLYGMESDIRGSGASAKKRYKTEAPGGIRSADQDDTIQDDSPRGKVEEVVPRAT